MKAIFLSVSGTCSILCVAPENFLIPLSLNSILNFPLRCSEGQNNWNCDYIVVTFCTGVILGFMNYVMVGQTGFVKWLFGEDVSEYSLKLQLQDNKVKTVNGSSKEFTF